MKKLEQQFYLKGIHKVIVADVSSPEAKKLHDEVAALQGKPGFEEKLNELNTRFKTRTAVIENVTPTEGRTILAKALSGNISAVTEVSISHAALGTGTNTPAVGDTQLQTETYRKAISSLTYADNIAYATAFYTATDTSGTFEEHGLFLNGSGTANSGDIISRLLLSSLVKSGSESLTIETSITINDA